MTSTDVNEAMFFGLIVQFLPVSMSDVLGQMFWSQRTHGVHTYDNEQAKNRGTVEPRSAPAGAAAHLCRYTAQVALRFDPTHKTEMVLRILSFGPMIRGFEPVSFIGRLRERIKRQCRREALLPGSPDETVTQEDGNSGVNRDRRR